MKHLKIKQLQENTQYLKQIRIGKINQSQHKKHN